MNNTVKHLLLLEEIETSYNLMNLGLGEIQNIGMRNDFRFLPFQLLSQGFGPFMKTYICLGHLHLHKKYPNPQYLLKLGHDLELLLNDILQHYFFEHDRKQQDL